MVSGNPINAQRVKSGRIDVGENQGQIIEVLKGMKKEEEGEGGRERGRGREVS